MNSLTLTKPDDWHLHLRDGDYLKTTVAAAARSFARAIVMPNLKPPISSVAEARNYHQKILSAIPNGLNFSPLMTLYLTQATTVLDIKEAKKSGLISAVKLYPAGVTTNSAAGVTDLAKIYPVLAAMEEDNLPLLIHAETNNPAIDIFEREQYFLDSNVNELIKRFPHLRMVVEHISSEYGVNFVKTAPKNIAATITAHHLLLNRNDLLNGGLKPHYYCLPIVKTQIDQAALIAAATAGNPKFFLGTDSAPHSQQHKESACCSAGIYTSHAAIELYATVFENAGALDKLENFASGYGADFYQLPRNKEKITLIKEEWQVPEKVSFGPEQLVPFYAGKTLAWKIK